MIRLRLLAGLAVLLPGCSSGASPGATSTTSAASASASAPVSAPVAVTPPTVARRGASLGAFTVTCHTGSARTASGRPDGPGLAAVDPAVVPLGSRVLVDRVGIVTAADRGGALTGRSLDFWAPSARACSSFGRQRLQVWRSTG
jgi:3D (Asp-Asp-Asp) domain-containing protein